MSVARTKIVSTRHVSRTVRVEGVVLLGSKEILRGKLDSQYLDIFVFSFLALRHSF